MKSLGRLEEAELLLKQALETQQRVYGPNNAKLVGALSQLGDLYRMQGKSGAAEVILPARAGHSQGEYPRDRRLFRDQSRARRRRENGRLRQPRRPEPDVWPSQGRRRQAGLRGGPALSSEPFVDGAQAAQAPRVEVTETARLAIRTITASVDWTSPQSCKAFQKQVFVFVPGFNVSFENALRRTAQIAYDVDFDGAAVLFSWPSGSGLTSYLYSSERTRTAADQLMAFLEKVVAQTGATKIHLIAHSMGSVVLLETLAEDKDQAGRQP